MNSEGCVYLGNVSVACKKNSGHSMEDIRALDLQSPSEGKTSTLLPLLKGPQLALANSFSIIS